MSKGSDLLLKGRFILAMEHGGEVYPMKPEVHPRVPLPKHSQVQLGRQRTHPVRTNY
jgi:hypothetical protein